MAKKHSVNPNRSPQSRQASARRRNSSDAGSEIGTNVADAQMPTAMATAADMPGPSTPAGVMDAQPAPSYEEIAEAAYQRYLRRGGGHGQDFDDWLEAERELRARR